MPALIFSPDNLPEYLASLQRLWDERRGGRPMPARSDFQAEEFAPWLSRIALIEVLPEPGSFSFKVYGSELVSGLGQDMTGHKFTSNDYARIVQKKVPCCVEDRAFIDQSIVNTRALVLPLSEDGVNANLLLACFHRQA